MPAHDDNISDKRRRLFKALSTVPVVMTLQPGSALANSSAYQCVKNMPEPRYHYRPDEYADNCRWGDCFVYQPRSCWDCGKGTKTVNFERFKHTLSYYLDKMIVETDGQFVCDDEVGTIVPTGGAGLHCRKYYRNGREYLKLKMGDKTCVKRIPTEQGWFLAVGETDSHTPRFFRYKGVYPKMRTNGTGQHGITGSCMNSIPHDIRGQYRILSGG